MVGPDALARILAQPSGQAQPMAYRQGTVLTFDPVTLENTVQVGDTVVANLPLLGVESAATLAPGAVVGIMTVGSTWAIIGRFVIPDTADAQAVVLALANRLTTATVATDEDATSGSWTDLATFGPQATAMVGPSGRALVLLSALMAVEECGGQMGFEVADASGVVLAADTTRAILLGLTIAGGSLVSTQARAVELSGLTPGQHAFTAKYQRTFGANPVTFAERNITVFAL